MVIPYLIVGSIVGYGFMVATAYIYFTKDTDRFFLDKVDVAYGFVATVALSVIIATIWPLAILASSAVWIGGKLANTDYKKKTIGDKNV